MKRNGLNSSKGSKLSKSIFFVCVVVAVAARNEQRNQISSSHMNIIFYGRQNVNLYSIYSIAITFVLVFGLEIRLVELIFVSKAFRGQ